MRKRLIASSIPEPVGSGGEGWLDLERTALVEVTPEEKDLPVESALVSGVRRRWRNEGLVIGGGVVPLYHSVC